MSKDIKFFPSGDSGIIIEFGNEISQIINTRIRSLVYSIGVAEIDEIVEMVPTYTTILVIYNPLQTTYTDLVNKIKNIASNIEESEVPAAEVIHIPTLYGGEYGMDLEHVAQHNNISTDEVVKIHSSTSYLVYMLGFTPGFPYLGGMSEKIATPRLKTPREKLAAGSVGIAGSQTGVYPIESPGGWQIIGRTPVKLFDVNNADPVLLRAGQYIKFDPITEDEYNSIKAKINDNSYIVKKTTYEGEL